MTATTARLGTSGALALLLGALALSGCGHGDSATTRTANTASTVGSTTESAPVFSRKEFLARANALCAKERAPLGERVAAYMGQHPPGSEPRGLLYAGLAHFVLLPVVEAELESIYYLGTPRGGAARLDEVLVAEKRALDELAVRKRIPSRRAVEDHFKESAKLLRAYGLTACANDPRGHSR